MKLEDYCNSSASDRFQPPTEDEPEYDIDTDIDMYYELNEAREKE